MEGISSDFLTAVLTYWPFLGMALIFYFMLYRPQKKDQKKRELLLNSLKKGDKVMVISENAKHYGMKGIIDEIKGSEALIKFPDIKSRIMYYFVIIDKIRNLCL